MLRLGTIPSFLDLNAISDLHAAFETSYHSTLKIHIEKNCVSNLKKVIPQSSLRCPASKCTPHAPRMGFATVPPARTISSPVLQAAWDKHYSHNSSTRHPVFFTERLRRSPAALESWSGGMNNPVAHGYVYQEVQRDGTNSPKL
ncbi:hypothetical protein ED733_001319 [Metarhizium rileyi]|uniref:Uncharacterized protein n=1 Tax=Metarhizium rileyi (strain RCEF 4871) TaxID=1649241 RepID=A0A5C6GIP7_METRR|nr:hypothetical protein ED733_001319 [Metarhizium rileyi]